jgi:acyl dehydratase
MRAAGVQREHRQRRERRQTLVQQPSQTGQRSGSGDLDRVTYVSAWQVEQLTYGMTPIVVSAMLVRKAFNHVARYRRVIPGMGRHRAASPFSTASRLPSRTVESVDANVAHDP